MTHRKEQFDVAGAPRIFIRLPAGEARVVGGDEGRVEVRMSGREATLNRFLIEDRGGQIVIEPESGRFGLWSRLDLEIRLGPGADVHARLASGDVSVSTGIAGLTVESGSGDVDADEVSGDVRIKTASGDVRIDSIGGRLEIAAAAGDVRIGSVGSDLSAKTASGDIEVGEAAASVTARAASGDIGINRFTGESFNAKTLSGDVQLGLAGGRRFSVSFQTLSGDVRTDFPVAAGKDQDGSARLGVKTMSGDIVVRAVD